MKYISLSGIRYQKETFSAGDSRLERQSIRCCQEFQEFPVKAGVVLFCLLLFLHSVLLPVHAAGITEQEASLQVEIFARSVDGKTASPVSGASLVAVQVAALSDPEDRDADSLYTVTDAAAKAGITDADLKGMDAAASSAAARKAAAAFRTGGKAEGELRYTFIRKAVSDETGIASFGSILREHFGIFVVYQTGKNREAARYLDIEPFLVQVPQPDVEKTGSWEYQVRTIPKLAEHTPVPEKPSTPPDSPEKPETPDRPKNPSAPTTPSNTRKTMPGSKAKGSTSPVKTGDLQNPVLWAGVFAAAGLLLIVFSVLRKKSRHREEGI